jgi:hypothetical protein
MPQQSVHCLLYVLLAAWASNHILIGSASAASYDGRLQINAVDEETHQPLAVRMELRDARGRLVRVHPDGAVVWDSSIYFDGSATLELRRGAYTFLIEAGPEFRTRPGSFTIDRRADDSTQVTLSRRVDMRKEGWLAGDLEVQLSSGVKSTDLPLVMRARGLDFLPLISAASIDGKCHKIRMDSTAWNSSGERLYGPWTGFVRRQGANLLLVGGNDQLDICQWKPDQSNFASLQAASAAEATTVVASPDAWELPIWIAGGELDAVAIMNLDTADVTPRKYAGRPYNRTQFAGKQGHGRYCETVYHQLLECGLRIAPAAGSGAGAAPAGRAGSSILGQSRIYVNCGQTFTKDSWLAGLRAGRVSVTNGPLLRTQVEGAPPGQVFDITVGQERSFEIGLDLAFYEQAQVEYLEIIQNGEVVHEIRLADFAKEGGRLPQVRFKDSGWFLVRAVTNHTGGYQYATTGAYFVEASAGPRISRKAVKYFQDWLDDAESHFDGDSTMSEDIVKAREFWNALASRANVD